MIKDWTWYPHFQPKKKKKPKPQPEASAELAPPGAVSPEEGKDEMNGFHANGSVMDGESLDSLSEQLDSASLDAAELDSEPATSETTGNHGFNVGKKTLHLVFVFVCFSCSQGYPSQLSIPLSQLT